MNRSSLCIGRNTPPPEAVLHRVELTMCELCLMGAGGECHVPGCSFWMVSAPDISVKGRPGVEVRETWEDTTT